MADQTSTNGLLLIGTLAQLTGMSVDTLRHYERKGLLQPQRGTNGYRVYAPQAVERVRLVQGALALGFTLNELARVFRVRDQGGAPCRQVLALMATKLEALEQRLQAMTALRDDMRTLLQGWEQRLEVTPTDQPARLLEDLSATKHGQGLAAATWQTRNGKRKGKSK